MALSTSHTELICSSAIRFQTTC